MHTASNHASTDTVGTNGDENAERTESSVPEISTRWQETRRKLKNFTLSWFSVCMGTGAVAQLLYTMPYRGPGQHVAGIVFFLANLVLFILFTLATVTRYVMFPHIPRLILHHPSESLYVGAIPMAMATLVNMTVLAGAHLGQGIITLALVGWWLDAAISLTTCFLVTYFMISRHEHNDMRDASSIWLLPIVSAPVASSTAAILIPYLDTRNAYIVLVSAYVLWGFGVMLASMILIIYLQRLIFHHLPPKQLIVSIWLPIGYLGQGIFAIVKLGSLCDSIFKAKAAQDASFPLADAGPVFFYASALFGLLFWGFSMWWLLIAIFAVLDHVRLGFPFSLGWWTFVFPLASLVSGTFALGVAFDAQFFDILGEIMAWAAIVLYTMVFLLTIRQSYRGTLFYAPCLNTSVNNEKK
jgi:C4-dicarboxylate transporter/malic acid transport protein